MWTRGFRKKIDHVEDIIHLRKRRITSTLYSLPLNFYDVLDLHPKVNELEIGVDPEGFFFWWERGALEWKPHLV